MADPLDDARRPWETRADRLIVRRFRSIRALALTGDLTGAVDDLADLHHSLIGPNGSGLVGDARARFYADTWRITPHDQEVHDPAMLHPHPAEAQAARTAPVGGIDAHLDLGMLIDRARRGLVTAIGNPTVIATWHQQQSTAVRAWARRTISDSQIGINAVTNALRLKPEYQD